MPNIKKAFSKIKINKYFVLLFLVCTAAGYFKDVVLLFLFVFLHELCHVLSAYILKIKVKDIELFPFGGTARIDNLDYVGIYKEIVINIAGPMFNAATAIFLLLLKHFKVPVPYYTEMMSINIVLFLFNMLPGFPLDGGKILRAVLNYFIGFKKASRFAILSGKIISICIFLAGILLLIYGKFNISFFVMPFFMLYSSRQEESSMVLTIIRDMINKKSKLIESGIMETGFICAFEDAYVNDIIKHIDLDKYHIIIVIGKDMKLKGFLTESQVFDGIVQDAGNVTLGKLLDNII